jgi:hypothetical protein
VGGEIPRLNETGALNALILRAKRRQLSHLTLHAASMALVVALGGAIALLIVGAQILSWYWIIVLFAVGLGVGAYRLRATLLSPYQIAQSLDHRLGFKDALSTAHYFAEHPDRAGVRRDFVATQREGAETLARSANMTRGMPFFAPRTAYVNVALVAVALGMFGLRYGIKRNLDLGSPLVHINLDGFFGNSPKVADARAHGKRILDADGQRDPAENPWDSKSSDRDPATDAALQSVEDPQTKNGDAAADGSGKEDAKATQELPPGNNPVDSGEKGDAAQSSDAQANPSPNGDSKSGEQNASKDAKDSNQSGNSAQNSSLSGKLRDAINNLLAKMKPQSKQSSGKAGDSQSASSKSSQQGEKQDGDPKSGQEKSDSSASSQSEGEQQQGGTQQASQGKSDGRSNSQPNSPDGKSGIGKQDGDKAAREAAELAAMGKISEIIGKRSANITGEMMVEVSSGKQQLKTQYSDRNGSHAEAGGEVNRDEVPLAYQQYVQQYFAQMRKQPAAKSKAVPDSKPAASSDAKTKPAPASAP